MNWPSYFPPECPPPDATVAEGEVYRLVAHNPPQPSDFVPLAIEQPHRDFARCACKACGISLYRDPADIKRLQDRVPGHRNKVLARGILDAQDGVMKPTPSEVAGGASHHTLWIPEGVETVRHFEVIEGGAK